MEDGTFRKDSIEHNMRNAIGIDLGCTNIKAVLVDHAGNVLHHVRQETREHDDQFWKSSVAKIIADFKAKSNGVTAVGLCAPGLANAENTFIACMPGTSAICACLTTRLARFRVLAKSISWAAGCSPCAALPSA